MIVWLNGAFGVGKTTTSGLLAKTLPGARVFDAERAEAVNLNEAPLGGVY